MFSNFFITHYITFCMISFCLAILTVSWYQISKLHYVPDTLGSSFFTEVIIWNRGSVLAQNVTCIPLLFHFVFFALIIKLSYVCSSWIDNEFLAGGKKQQQLTYTHTHTKNTWRQRTLPATLQLIPAPTAQPAAWVKMTPQASGESTKLFVWDYL